MIKIELVKFEAQDVITASVVAAPACKHANKTPPVENHGWWVTYCKDCKEVVSQKKIDNKPGAGMPW